MGGRTRRSVIVGGCVVSRRRGGVKGPKTRSLENEHNEPVPSPLTWKTLESMSRLPTSSMNTTNLAIPFPASGDRADEAGVAVDPSAAPAFFVDCCWARDGEALPPLLALLPSVLVLVEGAAAASWAPAAADAADPSPAAPAAAGAVGDAISSVDFFGGGVFGHLEQPAWTLLP